MQELYHENIVFLDNKRKIPSSLVAQTANNELIQILTDDDDDDDAGSWNEIIHGSNVERNQ